VAIEFKQPSLFCSVALMVPFVLVSLSMEHNASVLQMSAFQYCKPEQWKKRYFFLEPFISDSETGAFFLKLVDAKMRLRKQNWGQESDWNGRMIIYIRFVPLSWIQNWPIGLIYSGKSPNNGTNWGVSMQCGREDAGGSASMDLWTATSERGKGAPCIPK